jgi:hypothetical protein
LNQLVGLRRRATADCLQLVCDSLDDVLTRNDLFQSPSQGQSSRLVTGHEERDHSVADLLIGHGPTVLVRRGQ